MHVQCRAERWLISAPSNLCYCMCELRPQRPIACTCVLLATARLHVVVMTNSNFVQVAVHCLFDCICVRNLVMSNELHMS